jgi:hypothetical protein
MNTTINGDEKERKGIGESHSEINSSIRVNSKKLKEGR